MASTFYGVIDMKSRYMLALAFGALFSTGCATSSEVRLAKDEAMDAAGDASRKAEEALREAKEARRLAQDADARASRAEEMLNRSFKRSMYK
jgi:hypothetical protein